METYIDTLNKNVMTYFIGAFSLVVALAWNTAINAFFNKYFPKKYNEVSGRFIT